MKTDILVSCLAVSTMLGAAPAFAADESAATEIVVTATKRAENVQTVPLSVTVLSAGALEQRGAVRMEDYARLSPGLLFASNGANGGTLAIRGITTSTLAGNTQSPVALYYDEMPALNSFVPLVVPDMRLFDVERVEVLRGPQGTLFGSGALGGAIRVITEKPTTDAVAAKGEATIADTRGGSMGYSASGMVNVPLSERAAMRAVGYYERVGGYVDNAALGRKNVDRAENWGGRIMLALKPSDDVDLLATVTHQDDRPRDAPYEAYAGPPHSANSRAAQFTRQKSTTYNLVANADLGFAGLTSSTTYVDQEQAIVRDFSGITATLGIAAPGPYDAGGPSKTFAQEVRLASGDEGPLHWLIGGFYLSNRRTLTEILTIPGAGALLAPIGFPSDDLFVGISHIRTRETAVFGELSYDLTERLSAAAGARAFWNRIHVRNTGTGIFAGGAIANDRLSKDDAITPKFALKYKATDDVMAYAQAAKGYRIGQLNLGPAVDPSTGITVPVAYGPDSLWNYELGVKSQIWDRRVTLNVAAYYIDWKDIQLQDSTPSGFAFINNAGHARSQGIEIETRFQPTRQFEFGVSGAINSTRLKSISPGVSALVGDRLPGSPRFTFADYAQYRLPLDDETVLQLRVDHQHMGKAYSALNNPTALRFGGFDVVNLRAGIEWHRAEIIAFANNLFDSNGKTNAVQLPAGPTAVRLRPRTIGLTARVAY